MQDIPKGHVEIEITLDEDGNFKKEILRHGAGTSCKTEDDNKLLKDIFDLGQEDDWGHTDEHYEQLETTETVHKDAPFKQKKQKHTEEKQTHLGFGV